MVRPCPFVLVGGTNGKGSVALHLAYLLHQSGLRVGLFLSPHLSDVCERISVDGVLITPDELYSLLPKSNAHTFPQLTAAAWHYFAKQKVDIAILEVGLGGRLDPTNVGMPDASIITSIGLDHQELLGQTLTEILLEKLPIARAGKPLFLARLDNHLTTLAQQWCQAHGAKLHLVDGDNLALAWQAYVWLMQEHFSDKQPLRTKPLHTAALPGRMQAVDRFIIDIAHNDPALIYLSQRMPQPYTCIIAQPQAKRWHDGLYLLGKAAERLICVQMDYIENGQTYFVPAAVLQERLLSMQLASVVAPHLRAAMQLSSGPTLITGSSRLAGMALTELGIPTTKTPYFARLDPVANS